MRHQINGRNFGRTSGHRALLLRNLVTDLLRHEKIVTTEAKAKEMKGIAEKMITLGKDDSVAARRRAAMTITDKDVVSKLFSDISPRYKNRPGGYTRLLRMGPRVGDGAPQCRIELVK